MRCCLEMDETPKEAECRLISVVFNDGPLGVTLRRRAEDGIVFVFDIVDDSQAVMMDIEIGDELWAIGQSEIGDVALDKEAWNGLVQYIKFSPRPLKATWKRRPSSSLDGSLPDDDSSPQEEVEQESEAQEIAQRKIEYNSEKATESKHAPQKPPKSSKQAPPNLSNDDSDILELSAKLVLKDKEKPSFANGFATIAGKKNTENSAINLVKEGRRILKMGELETTSKAALAMWATQNKRMFILLTDLLIIATPIGQTLQVENMIDLQVCKLYCEGQINADNNITAVNSDKNNSERNSDSRNQGNGNGVAIENCFQLIWPGGTLQITAKNPDEKEYWVNAIFAAICDCVEEDSRRILGWRHQYMLGSMHAAVITRDESKVRELVNKCENGQLDFTVIDSVDDDGYTPLHYACILRLQAIIRILHDAGADTTVEDSRGLTAIHWSALQLDAIGLDIICKHVVDIDVLDRQGRTPLYLACVEGRDVSGRTDTRQLSACVLTMLSHNADTDYRDKEGYSILHYLAASWQHEPLKVILDHKVKANIYTFSAIEGMNALHYATDATPLKKCIGEGSRILSNNNNNNNNSDRNDDDNNVGDRDQGMEELLLEDGLPTLRALLKAGQYQC